MGIFKMVYYEQDELKALTVNALKLEKIISETKKYLNNLAYLDCKNEVSLSDDKYLIIIEKQLTEYIEYKNRLVHRIDFLKGEL